MNASHSGVFSHSTDEWETPQDFYDRLNAEFHFTLDPCATETTHKCARWYGAADDGLSKDWGGEHVFCNPPYSQAAAWARKCFEESRKPGTVVVLLIPSRTDTRYFHSYIYNRSELRFVKGRLRFSKKLPAPFPSMVAVFRGPDPDD
jgi:phage N-6-adenine-methyltransferase